MVTEKHSTVDGESCDDCGPSVLTLRQLSVGAYARFFEWASQRQNDTLRTSIAYLARVLSVREIEALNFAKQLASLGYAKVLAPHNRKQSRILWLVSLKSLGYVVLHGGHIAPCDPDLLEDNITTGDNKWPQNIPEIKKILSCTWNI